MILLDTVIGYVRELLGAVPAGYEPLEYIVSGFVLVMLCMSAVSMISGLFKWIGGL